MEEPVPNDLETKLTDAVIAPLSGDADPRFRRIMPRLIRHAHEFVREVELTEEEWFEAIKFLTATGQKCADKRQEFILLSDVLRRRLARIADENPNRVMVVAPSRPV